MNIEGIYYDIFNEESDYHITGMVINFGLSARM